MAREISFSRVDIACHYRGDEDLSDGNEPSTISSGYTRLHRKLKNSVRIGGHPEYATVCSYLRVHERKEYEDGHDDTSIVKQVSLVISTCDKDKSTGRYICYTNPKILVPPGVIFRRVLQSPDG